MIMFAGLIARPIATWLLAFGTLAIGLACYWLLPVAQLPQVDFPAIQVTASFPGTGPEVMASSVTAPLERQFLQIPGLVQMTSTSGAGVCQITLIFDLSENVDVAAQEVQKAIDGAGGDLPKNIPTPPTYRKVNPADTPIVVLAVHSDTLPISAVSDAAETIISQQVSQMPGVGSVAVLGQQKPAIRVQANPAALASRGLSLEDVRAVLARTTVNAPKGIFDGERQAFAIDANDQLATAADYRDVLVTYRDGAPVMLGDVATVIDSVENTKIAGLFQDRPAVLLSVLKRPGANVIATVDGIKAKLDELKSALPPAIDVELAADRTQTIRASVTEVQMTLLLTIGLVILVIFVFLRSFRTTLIPSITVPISLLGTCVVMYLLGYSLDNLSLMALTISVGFVVDDAIVMVENITRYLEAGDTRIVAAIKGAREVGFTILSITISLVAVFIPLLFMGGLIGRLFREFAVTLSTSIIVSAIVSLTLTPTMCAQLLRSSQASSHGRLGRGLEQIFDGALALYASGLRWVLRHQNLTLLATLATLLATVWLYVIVPKGFFPQQDTGFLVSISEAGQDVSFASMAERQSKLTKIILADPAVQGVASFTGPVGFSQSGNNGAIFIQLKPLDERGVTADQVIARLRPQLAQIPGIALYMQVSQDINAGGRVSRTQFQYTLQDANIAELDHWAPILRDALAAIPILRDVASDLQIAGPTISLDIDRRAAARLGIDVQMIDDTLYDAFGQRQVSTVFGQVNQYRVILEADPAFQLDPTSLQQLYVKSAAGTMVPLSAFTKINDAVRPLTINHQRQFPAVTLSFNLAPGAALGAAATAIQEAERDLRIPATLHGSFQGNAQAFQASLQSQPYLIAAAIIAVYIILGMLYESCIHPITILSTLPSAGLGALLALLLFHYDLSIIALIGIILLIGIVKKNAIMMIDFALAAERRDGLSPQEAIYRACLLRFRPIIMTSFAAMLGGVPLALGSGAGSEIRQPLGYVIVGGLLVSQILTLYTTPVIFLALDRLGRHVAYQWRNFGSSKAARTVDVVGAERAAS
jgi:hydrophobe/amphiphile efflux-1 (HAE1) family protein